MGRKALCKILPNSLLQPAKCFPPFMGVIPSGAVAADAAQKKTERPRTVVDHNRFVDAKSKSTNVHKLASSHPQLVDSTTLWIKSVGRRKKCLIYQLLKL